MTARCGPCGDTSAGQAYYHRKLAEAPCRDTGPVQAPP